MHLRVPIGINFNRSEAIMEYLYTRTDDDPNIEVVVKEFTAYGVTVPRGFRFDGASTPRAFWSIVPPFKGVKVAALIHDYLCREAKNKEERKKADELFLFILKDMKAISTVRSYVAYAGVRTGSFFGVGNRF